MARCRLVLEVKPPQTGGDVIQILTRNSYARNMMTFERVLSGRTGDISDWNYVPKIVVNGREYLHSSQKCQILT